RRVLGTEHPNTAYSVGLLAQLEYARGDGAAAEVLARQAQAVHAGVFGGEHAEYARWLNTLGLGIELQGRLVEAEHIFAECLRIGRAQLPRDHPGIASYLVNLAPGGTGP